MHRKTFITKSALSLLGGPLLLSSPPLFSKTELMGLGHPKLYGKTHRLLKRTKHAFEKMQAAAKQDGIAIQIVSAYRDYAHQKRIWERKYRNFAARGMTPMQAIYKIIAYSTIPGTSRHHWGTDIDIIDANPPRPKQLLNPKNFGNDGLYCELKAWMDAHAERFGFLLVYTDAANRKGFQYEPWHFSYAPLAIPMLQEFKKIDLYEALRVLPVLGFSNISESFIKKYRKENLLDINPKLI